MGDRKQPNPPPPDGSRPSPPPTPPRRTPNQNITEEFLMKQQHDLDRKDREIERLLERIRELKACLECERNGHEPNRTADAVITNVRSCRRCGVVL